MKHQVTVTTVTGDLYASDPLELTDHTGKLFMNLKDATYVMFQSGEKTVIFNPEHIVTITLEEVVLE